MRLCVFCAHVVILINKITMCGEEGTPTSTCMHLCDPVLAYITMSLKNSTKDMIKRSVLSHFSSKQLVAAKKVLWDVHSAELGENRTRKGSFMKLKEEFDLDDILNGLSLLDEHEVETKVVISVNDLQMLPKVMPEETLAISVVERLKTLEDEMKQIRSGILSKFPAAKQRGQHQHQPPSKSQQMMPPSQNPTAPPERRTRSVTRTLNAKRDSSGSVTRRGGESLEQGNNPPKSLTNNYNSMAEMVSDYGDEPFTDPRKNQRNRKNKEGTAQGKSDGGASKECKESELSGGSDTICIQLTNVNPRVNEANIKDHVAMQGADASKVKVSDTSSDGWPTKRFQVVFPRDMAEMVLATDFWPPKVYFREFFAPKPRGYGGAFNQRLQY